MFLPGVCGKRTTNIFFRPCLQYCIYNKTELQGHSDEALWLTVISPDSAPAAIAFVDKGDNKRANLRVDNSLYLCYDLGNESICV